MLVDTPGFDDSATSTIQIVNELLSEFYSIALRKPEVETRGVIFLHDISETRFAGSQKNILRIFKALVGDENMGNVIVGTTKWSPVGSAKFSQEETREKTLREEEWDGVYKTTRVFEGKEDTAAQIVKTLFTRPPVTLLCQKEMMQPPHTMRNTTVGRMILPEAHQEQEQLRREVKEQRRKLAEIEKAYEEVRGKEMWQPDRAQWMHGARMWNTPEPEEDCRKRKEKAKKRVEKLEEELKDSEEGTGNSEKPYEPGWFAWLLNLIIRWFCKTPTADETFIEVLTKLLNSKFFLVDLASHMKVWALVLFP